MADTLNASARKEAIETIRHELFGRTTKRHQEELDELITTNSELCGNNQPWLSYANTTYFKSKGIKPQGEPMNLVHSSLMGEVEEFVTKARKQAVKEDMALGYLRAVFLETSIRKDIYALLPRALHRAFGKVDRHFLSMDGRLHPEFVEAFKVKHNKYLTVIKARLAYNLLDVAKI